jgi:hypothetical protein
VDQIVQPNKNKNKLKKQLINQNILKADLQRERRASDKKIRFNLLSSELVCVILFFSFFRRKK